MRQNVYDYSFEMRRERQRNVSLSFLVILSIIAFLSVFMTFVLFPIHVSSDSMESDLSKNGAAFVCPLSRSPKRGEVIYLSRLDGKENTLFENIVNVIVDVFTAQHYHPFGYSTNLTGKPCVRRVLALPGDSLYMKDYILYVKPAGQDYYLTEFEVAEKPYNIHIYSVPAQWDGVGLKGDMKEITLGENQYFVLADNRIESADSRLWGSIDKKMIRGKVVLQYFPFTKIRLF